MFSPAVQITLPHSMYFIDSDGNRYIAEQMHFHWGGKDSEVSGSEHTFDGTRHMMEVCDNPHTVPFPSGSGVTFFVSVSACLCYARVMYVRMHVSVHTRVCVHVEARG